MVASTGGAGRTVGDSPETRARPFATILWKCLLGRLRSRHTAVVDCAFIGKYLADRRYLVEQRAEHRPSALNVTLLED